MDLNILDLYFKNHKYPFTSHHLDSYREFIKTYLPQTIKSYNPITMIKYDDLGNISMKVDMFVGGKDGEDIFIDRPITYEDGNQKLITPNETRLKNLTYETHLYANVHVEITDDDNNKIEKKFQNVAIGSIPIMVHSDICILHGQGSDVLRELGECIYDTGGYFIINGNEKVVIAQERTTTNRLFITKTEDDNYYSHKAVIRCTGETGETVLSPRTIEFQIVKYSEKDLPNEDEINEETLIKKIVTEKVNDYIQGAILVSIPSFKEKVPLCMLFRALGIESDKDIYESIFGRDYNNVEKAFFDDFIRPSFISYSAKTQEHAINEMTYSVKYKTIDHVKYILTTDVFPNIPIFENKGKYLGYLIKQLFNTVYHISPETDKDSYIYKRVDISGYLLSELFHESYSKLRKSIRDKMDSIYHYGAWSQKTDFRDFITEDNIYKIIPNLLIAQTFTKSLKGSWGIVDEKDPDLQKVQDLSRISFIGFLSHLRRVNIPLDRSIKITGPHKLHCNQYGIMCPFETPDGASVGYLKNLAFLTKIASGTSSENIKKCLVDIGAVAIENYHMPFDKNTSKIFINGSLYGVSNNPILLVRTLKAYRRNSLINILISISWNIKSNEIRILTEAGRPCRPLIISKNKDIPNVKNWFDLISGKTLNISDDQKSDEFYYRDEYINPRELEQFKDKKDEQILDILEKNIANIEFLDIEEEDTCLIAMNEQDVTIMHTHMEIYASSMFSVVSANIPLANHNQSARNVFHAAQSKQAIGIYASNFNKRFDTMAYVQHYPQRPIITTQLSQYTCSDNMPNGFNVIVAIMTYTGFNQEDSIMINKNSVERGLFNLSYYKSITGTAKEVSQNERIIFGNPLHYKDKGLRISHAKYSLLDDNGFIKEGSYVSQGQRVAAIGMIKINEIYKEVKKGVFTELVKETKYSDVSLMTDDSVYGIVNKVYVTDKSVGNNSSVCKVRFLKIRKPEFGDKHASRHGQKGVIGMIIPEESMPFTKDGIRPDIIINPHAIPSRMTIGHLVECVFSKLCCLNGSIGDGSVFVPLDEKKIYKDLGKYGFDKHGNEILYNGFTGQQLHSEIFIGPTFYFRLKHMVADKINSRGHNRDNVELPSVMLTRQPTSGRRKGGGLRIGEMERDSVLSHGTSLFLKESMMERSDKFSWAVCKRCGVMSVYNPSKKKKITRCDLCKKNNIVVVRTPYAFKLLTQELQCMGIEMRLNTESADFPFEDLQNDDYTYDDNTDDKEIKLAELEEDDDINDEENSDDDMQNGGEGESENDLGELDDLDMIEEDYEYDSGNISDDSIDSDIESNASNVSNASDDASNASNASDNASNASIGGDNDIDNDASNVSDISDVSNESNASNASDDASIDGDIDIDNDMNDKNNEDDIKVVEYDG